MRLLANAERTWAVHIERKVEDCWIGVFWRRQPMRHGITWGYRLDVWICIVPCFPIHIMRFKRYR